MRKSSTAVIAAKLSGSTYKEGKVVRLNAWLKEQSETLEGSWFYSDSINDLPLLLEVDHAVAVDPCPALQAVAEEKHWQIISLRRLRKHFTESRY